MVLVSCGSFNPPTVMHMRVCELAAQHMAKVRTSSSCHKESTRIYHLTVHTPTCAVAMQLGHDVWGCYMSPVSDAYGKPGLAPAFHRLNMCAAATQESPLIMTAAWEAQQPGYTPTLHVLRHIKQVLATWLQEGGRPLPVSERDDHGSREGQVDGTSPGASLVAPLHPDFHEAFTGRSQANGQDCQPAEDVSPASAPLPAVMLLCGADVLASLTQPGLWQGPDELLQEHGAVCVDRPHGHGSLPDGRLQALLNEGGGLLCR